MEEYLEQVLAHLPIQFIDDKANSFIEYLSNAYSENIKNGKYQFSFIAFHMLYMTFCYKTKWFLKRQENKKIKESIEVFLKVNSKKFFNGLFDLSQFGEKDTIYHLLHSLNFDIIETNEHKKCVDVRNNCAHANGKIRYNREKIISSIEEEAEFMEKIQEKMSPELKKFLKKFLEENWKIPFISGDFDNFFKENYLSLKDLEIIGDIDLELLKVNSISEKIIKEKVLYLLLIFNIQNRIGIDENLFLERLPFFMVGLPEKIKVINEEEKEIYTNNIIDEFLIPILNKLSDEDRIKAEKILKLI